ncbi:MAG: hypothetical protein HW380_4026 [Magnetococcales bacterium]|nr:hypothetical protein [Magnetococcales bacterium]
MAGTGCLTVSAFCVDSFGMSRNPFLEWQSLGFVGTTQEEVESLLGEGQQVLCTAGGNNGCDPFPFIWDVDNPF